MNLLFKVRFRNVFTVLLGLMVVALMAFKNGNSSFSESDVEVTLKMENLKPQKSVVFVAVFQNSDTFLGKDRFKSMKIDNPGETSISKKIRLPQGTYGIAVFQDLNENGTLDKNFIGIPNEPYCFSNGAVGRFGPPSWDAAKIKIENNTVLKFNF